MYPLISAFSRSSCSIMVSMCYQSHVSSMLLEISITSLFFDIEQVTLDTLGDEVLVVVTFGLLFGTNALGSGLVV